MENNTENNFNFEIVEIPVAKSKQNKNTSINKNNDPSYTFVMPEIVEFEEIDESFIISTNDKKFKPSFDDLIYDNENASSYVKNNRIRNYNNEADWDLLRSLVIMKVIRKNRRNKQVVLDDIVEFRLLPNTWAEELCNYLFKNNFNFVVYEDESL